MTSENKICQNCKQQFTIEPEDFNFYEKMKVPAPTWCPECRFVRRFLWRNERSLYRRKCDLCHKDILSAYDPRESWNVYCYTCWWGDGWDPLAYGKEYDFKKPFFEQFIDLLHRVPITNLWGFDNVNCEYANHIGHSKNCYFSFSIVRCEDIYYSTSMDRSLNCVDCDLLNDSQFCYENVNGGKNYESVFLANSRECVNSAFLYDCANCQQCFMSNNLRNKQFVFRNQQLSREEYLARVQEINIGSFKTLKQLEDEFLELKQHALRKYGNILKCNNVSGDDLVACKNAKVCFKVQQSEDLKYCWRIVSALKDAYDISGALSSELVYEGSVAANFNYGVKFYSQFHTSKDSEYCIYGSSASNLFGCVGVRSKQYCILNKQYTEQEYKELVPKIIPHMNEMPFRGFGGRTYGYGEFFPVEFSPFAYNETVAQEYFPLTREETAAQGYRWKEPLEHRYAVTAEPDKLPDHINDVADKILDEIVGCAHAGACNDQCTTAFRIVPQELQFYRKMKLPLPRLCPNCRHYARARERNPLRLWHRKCTCAGAKSDNNVYTNTISHFHGADHCPNEFETSYAPERPEIVYCENCYNSEVV